jgi:hemerythrin
MQDKNIVLKYEKWKWSDKLITGNAAVDFQHNMLFVIINNLISVCNADTLNRESMEEVLGELIRYVAYHFKEEEDLMKRHDYDGFQCHQDEHCEFESAIMSYGIRFKNNEDISTELLQYMNSWLVEHILVVDMETMRFCVN